MKTIKFNQSYKFSNDGGITVLSVSPDDVKDVSDKIAERLVWRNLAEIVEAEAPADADPEGDPEGGKGDGEGEGSELDCALQQRKEGQEQLIEARARIAEIEELDMQLEDGKVLAYRAKVKISFKYEGS